MFEIFYLLNNDYKKSTHWNKRLHLPTIELSLNLKLITFLKK